MRTSRGVDLTIFRILDLSIARLFKVQSNVSSYSDLSSLTHV